MEELTVGVLSGCSRRRLHEKSILSLLGFVNHVGECLLLPLLKL